MYQTQFGRIQMEMGLHLPEVQNHSQGLGCLVEAELGWRLAGADWRLVEAGLGCILACLDMEHWQCFVEQAVRCFLCLD
jgi:hypothetical protein